MQIIEEQIFEDVERDVSEKYVLKHVKLIGVKSDNNRKYPIEVLMEGKDLYHDVPVYLGHNRSGAKRIYTERVGVIKNPYCKENGIYGELHLNPFHQSANSIQWDYEHNSKRVGLSHDAEGLTKNGVVQKLTQIHSVDLVTEAATTQSLKEEVDEIEKIKSQLAELNTRMDGFIKENERLLEEIDVLKKRKPVISGSPEYTPEKLDIGQWVQNLRKS